MPTQLHHSRWFVGVMLAATSILFTASFLNATCINVNSCRTISQSGSYCLQPSVTLSSNGGDCLVISAPNVSLSNGGGPDSIVGAGTGAAIHVLSTATHFVGQFFCPYIDDFNVAVRDDANGAFFGNSNDCPLSTGTNVNYGILFNSVTGSQYIGGSGNLQARDIGLLIRGGRNNYISSNAPDIDKQSFQGGAAGIQIDSGSTGNVLYGVVGYLSQNGIHLVGGTAQNFIYLSGATKNNVGIKIEQNSTRNFIIHNSATSNSSTDMADLNSNCDRNAWAENTFTLKNQGCIQ